MSSFLAPDKARADWRDPQSIKDCLVWEREHPLRSRLDALEDRLRACSDGAALRFTLVPCYGETLRSCAPIAQAICEQRDQIRSASETCRAAWDAKQAKLRLEREEQRARERAERKAEERRQEQQRQQVMDTVKAPLKLARGTEAVLRQAGLVKGGPSGASRLSAQLSKFAIQQYGRIGANSLEQLDAAFAGTQGAVAYSPTNPRPSEAGSQLAIGTYGMLSASAKIQSEMPGALGLGQESIVLGPFSSLAVMAALARRDGKVTEPMATAFALALLADTITRLSGGDTPDLNAARTQAYEVTRSIEI